MIPKEIMKKYNLPAFEEWQDAIDAGAYDDNTELYKFFLQSTDYLIFKLFEGSLSSADVAEELKYREVARQKLAEANGKTYEINEEKQTLEERTTNIEADTLSFIVDHEERLICLELGITE